MNRITAAAFIRREALTSAIINGVISVVFMLIVFGTAGRVPVWGVGNYAFDFVPQSFAIGLMATLVPGLIARKAVRVGKIDDRAPREISGSLLFTAILVGAGSIVLGSGACAGLLWLMGVADLPFEAAFGFKVLYGATLGSLVTATVLKHLLTMSFNRGKFFALPDEDRARN